MRRWLEASVLEGGAEERGMLEAVAAAPIADQLPGDAVEVDADAAPKQDVEVFKRDAHHVRAHQPGQRLERRFEY